MSEQLVTGTIVPAPVAHLAHGVPGSRPYRVIAITVALMATAFVMGVAVASGAKPAQPVAIQPAGSAFMGLTNSNAPYDLRFIDAMIPHHEGAIVSVQAMITNSTHPELRDLGRRIVQVQQQQIDQMLTWRTQWYPDAAPLNPASLDMGMDMMSGGMLGGWMMGSGALTATQSTAPYGGMMGRGMMSAAGSAAPNGHNQGTGMMTGDQADRMFLRMMIPHHQLAIDMAQDALKNAQHPELKPLAQSIISGQSTEITEMEGYLKTWYGESSTRALATPMREWMQRMMDGASH